MSEEEKKQKAIVEISDFFGLGKIANSSGVERLVGAIVDGIGSGVRSLISPWSIRRQSKAQIEAATSALSTLPDSSIIEMELGERAELRIQRDSVRKQFNRESISELALISAPGNLPTRSNSDSSSNAISQDWLTDFWQKAESVSDERMKILWSKVLLQEAHNPRSLSKRSLRILSEISLQEAQMLEDLAPFVVEFERSNIQKLAAGILLTIGQFQGTFSVPRDVSSAYRDSVGKLVPDFDIVALDAAGIM